MSRSSAVVVSMTSQPAGTDRSAAPKARRPPACHRSPIRPIRLAMVTTTTTMPATISTPMMMTTAKSASYCASIPAFGRRGVRIGHRSMQRDDDAAQHRGDRRLRPGRRAARPAARPASAGTLAQPRQGAHRGRPRPPASATISDPSHRVKPGQTFAIAIPEARAAKPNGQVIALDVVYEDDDLIVVEQAGRPGRPSGARQSGHDPGQRADRALRRVAVRHRRRSAGRASCIASTRTPAA